MVMIEIANDCEYYVFDTEFEAMDFAIRRFEKYLILIEADDFKKEMNDAIDQLFKEHCIEDFLYMYTNVVHYTRNWIKPLLKTRYHVASGWEEEDTKDI